MAAASVYSRALKKAAELLGGREQLAQVLQIPAEQIDKWIADQGKPPREVFLRIVDLILDESRSGADSPENGDSQEQPPPRDAAGSRNYLD